MNKPKPSCIRTTIRVIKETRCTCAAYKFPHNVGSGLCENSVTERPEFCKPKKGLASKLCKLIDQLEKEVDSLAGIECDGIALLLHQFKENFYAPRATENEDLLHY